MYTNGYTKTPTSLVVVTNAPIGYQVYTTTEFECESEHIELRGHQAYVHSATPEPFDGFVGATLGV